MSLIHSHNKLLVKQKQYKHWYSVRRNKKNKQNVKKIYKLNMFIIIEIKLYLIYQNLAVRTVMANNRRNERN